MLSGATALVAAVLVLAAALVAAVADRRRVPDWAVAGVGAGMLVLLGAVSVDGARAVLERLAPTVALLAGLLVLGGGCRRSGLFDAIGDRIARRAGGSPTRLLGASFVAAAGVTAVLSLDATVVLLTPVIVAAAARSRLPSRPATLASVHLANAGSLLLPISNLTNLLALRASGLSFLRFAGLMLGPWAVTLAVEWWALRRIAISEAHGAPATGEFGDLEPVGGVRPWPLPALAVLVLTLVGFVLSGPLGLEPAWAAGAGGTVLVLADLARGRVRPLEAVRSAAPGFLVFVLALGVVVEAVAVHGLGDVVGRLAPAGAGLGALLGMAVLGAVLANLVNNLPATLLLLPVAALAGPASVLAVLIGVNIGPNLTWTGSLATLLWRRVLAGGGERVRTAELTALGLRTVPLAVVLATGALWLASRLLLPEGP